MRPSLTSLLKSQISRLVLVGLPVLALGTAAHAEMAISVYGGLQGAPHSQVEVSDGPDFTAGWEGNSFQMPLYLGARGTWWSAIDSMPNLGFSLDYTHAKVYADEETLATSTWDHFEFTDGLNMLTLNALYRFPIENSNFVPYVGAGAGVNVPHVEVTRGSGRTFGYQLGGATLQVQAGVDYKVTDQWSIFTEYKGNYSMIDVDIDSNASLKTNIWTNAVNFGVSYHF